MNHAVIIAAPTCSFSGFKRRLREIASRTLREFAWGWLNAYPIMAKSISTRAMGNSGQSFGGDKSRGAMRSFLWNASHAVRDHRTDVALVKIALPYFGKEKRHCRLPVILPGLLTSGSRRRCRV